MKQLNDVPFWDSSFREEVEGKKVDEGVLIWTFGGPTFALRTPQTMIYLDPYFGGDAVDMPAGMHRTTAVPLDPAQISLADIVLMSHEHYDHCHEDTLLAMATGTPAEFYGPAPVIKEMLAYGLPEERIHEVKPCDQFQVKDATVTVWEAYDEGAPQAVTYVVNSGGINVLFGGDGSAGPSFDQIGANEDLDIAMLAFGRTWYMSEPEILDAAMRLRPKLLLPYHWELWRGHTGDALELGRLVERRKIPFAVKVLLLGDHIYYHPGGQYEIY